MNDEPRCTCEYCWEKFSSYLQENDPEFLAFAIKFRHRWVGLFGEHDE